ncbi:MAG: MMPL family transporter [Panacagrimonas sp.]
MFGSTPLNFGHVMDFEAKHSTVSVWFKDNKQETVDAALAYKSFMASILLLIPVNLANLMQNAAMFQLGIGPDINATIVAVMGVGVGIDYGIYLLSRICEEYHVHEGDLGAAITTALTTTGKAIMFMAVIMLINMVLSLIVLPLVVWFFKPGFLKRTDLAVGEYVDLNQFMDDPEPVPAK